MLGLCDSNVFNCFIYLFTQSREWLSNPVGFSYIGHTSQHNTKQYLPSVWDIINSHVVLNEEICNETAQKAKFMGPTWGPPGSCRPQMDSMLAPWTLLSGCTCSHNRSLSSSVLLAARSIIHASISCTKRIYSYSAALRYAVNQEMLYLKSFTKILNRKIFSVHNNYSKETGRILVKFDTFVGCKKLYRCQCDQIPLRPNISPKCFFEISRSSILIHNETRPDPIGYSCQNHAWFHLTSP